MPDEILGKIELGRSLIPSGCRRHITEAMVKNDGCVWIIHKNDSDPFPSNPHAHNEESGLKLDLSNGKLYLRKEFAGEKIGKKELLKIRNIANEKNIPLPSLNYS